MFSQWARVSWFEICNDRYQLKKTVDLTTLSDQLLLGTFRSQAVSHPTVLVTDARVCLGISIQGVRN